MSKVQDNTRETKGKTATHTPEPYAVTDGLLIVASGKRADGTPFVDCVAAMTWNGPGGPDSEWITTSIMIEEARKNARRIVACVNACKGIPTEKLEYAASRDDDGSRFYWLVGAANAIVDPEARR